MKQLEKKFNEILSFYNCSCIIQEKKQGNFIIVKEPRNKKTIIFFNDYRIDYNCGNRYIPIYIMILNKIIKAL